MAKKVNYLLDLRYELSDLKISDTKNTFNNAKNYINLFPTVHLVYNLTPKTDLQLSCRNALTDQDSGN
jgi:hypothetical protein